MEVPSPQAGEVLGILVKVGDKVKTGAEVLRLSAAAGVVGPAQEAPAVSIKVSCKAADNREPMPASEPPQPSLPAAQNIPVSV